LKTNRFKKNEEPTLFKKEIVEEVIDIFREPCHEKGLFLVTNVEDNVPE
jgi:hypothetical protein